ncbi:helix-turn-helix domain-containing protein [Rhodococcus opacus]|uniref:helix-turn-helix domain-containing protein n=1 Tax=Rhodococcus opacus TaxID=37919 RepID=UPI00155A2763|nr:XRE family transcriptional regulator [Rhodococcus opacus]
MSEYPSAFDAIAETPAEAELKKTRAELMHAIRDYITDNQWTQIEAAKHFGVSQPRISDLMRGKMSKFSMDGLVGMAATAGLHVQIRLVTAA